MLSDPLFKSPSKLPFNYKNKNNEFLTSKKKMKILIKKKILFASLLNLKNTVKKEGTYIICIH